MNLADEGGIRLSFFLYLITAAWQDGRRRSVSGWMLLFFFSHFLASQVCQWVFPVDMERFPARFWYHGMMGKTQLWLLWAGSLIGAALLLISRLTEGALGEGDGLFFLIAGIYLGFWKNLILLCSALVLCSFTGLLVMVWGQFHGKDYRKKQLPFLVFTLPAGIFLAWM